MKIAITGGTGSLGTALTARLLADPTAERIVILSRDEYKQARLAEHFGHDARIRFFLGDVRDRARLVRAFHNIDVVVHAAALKRVDAVSYNPGELLLTNVVGTMNVVDAAIDAGVFLVVVISSDKSVHASNIYGASKFMAEQYASAANAHGRETRISVARYGNVLGSRGSVVHAWRRQIASGGPVLLTDARMTRFWLPMSGAVELVLDALAHMRGGEVFVPVLPSMRLEDLARCLAPEGMPVAEVGLRSGGEKIHEELIAEEEAPRTVQVTPYLYAIRPMLHPWTKDDLIQGEPVGEGFSYRSDRNTWTLTMEEMRKLLEHVGEE